MFQQEKILLMVPLEVWIQPEYILGVAGFKELHSYGRVKTISLVLIKGVEAKVITDDPELRKPKSYAAFVHDNIVACLEERISYWPRLKMSLVWGYATRRSHWRNRSVKELDHTKQHSVLSDLEGIRSNQKRHFGQELISLGKGRCLKSCSSIVKLDPFIDDERIFRVGGRIINIEVVYSLSTGSFIKSLSIQ